MEGSILKKSLVCQFNIDHKKCVAPMFIVGRELCLLLIEIKHCFQGRRFTDFRKDSVVPLTLTVRSIIEQDD
jgi:hypothetical protein